MEKKKKEPGRNFRVVCRDPFNRVGKSKLKVERKNEVYGRILQAQPSYPGLYIEKTNRARNKKNIRNSKWARWKEKEDRECEQTVE